MKSLAFAALLLAAASSAEAQRQTRTARVEVLSTGVARVTSH